MDAYRKQDLLKALINRGHSEQTIKDMSAEKRFDEYCNWHGLIGWGPTLRATMGAAMQVTPDDIEFACASEEDA